MSKTSFQNDKNITLKEIEAVKKKATDNLLYFAKLINPQREYGPIHEELFEWWTTNHKKDNQLALLPRGHQKSHCAAVKAAWDITRDPSTTILYISATSQLAEAQLYAIKQILTSDTYRRLWPDMVNKKEAARETWTTKDIIVDHPARKKEGVRDSTVAAKGVTSNITGLHCDAIYLDDLVVPNNAYTADGRSKVEALYSQLASVKNPGSHTTVVGTRYHTKDLYQMMLEITQDLYDEESDEKVGVEAVYDIMERVVEQQGVFLWPKKKRQDGKPFGFDRKELEKIRSEYIDSSQFYAQYYNNPNDPSNARITRDKIQYYSPKHLVQQSGHWYFKDRRLNVYAAIDFAFSLGLKSDYTAIVVIGVDFENNIYILDIDRFKTDKISIYFKHIVDLYMKWEFKKLRAETSVAQAAIVKELKETYIKREGLSIKIDEFKPSRSEGSKEERMASTLEPRYDNLAIWHYKGGNCNLLEEEIILAKPPHDDIKDALTAVIDIAVAPKAHRRTKSKSNIVYSSRFGGVAFHA